MKFGIMFFASGESHRSKYDLLIELAKRADETGFSSVWTPERHFDEFGSVFPNPSLTSAALAVLTRRIKLCAGSLISPLHDEVRIAEDWSVVDNLSNGRVAISFGAGWNVNDFIFFPERYEGRKDIMFEQIEKVRTLWSGGYISKRNSFGQEVQIQLHPKPTQKELPVWVTSSGSKETFARAGSIGANVLTHMINQNIDVLSEKIRVYRSARMKAGFHAGDGKVTLMLHTFVGESLASTREIVYHPFLHYLKTAVDLERTAAKGGGTISGGFSLENESISEDVLKELLELTFDRYFESASLMGIVESCQKSVDQLSQVGVDEIACLVDFGIDESVILEHFDGLIDLVQRYAPADPVLA